MPHTARKHITRFIILLVLYGLAYAVPGIAEDRGLAFSYDGLPVSVEQCVWVGDTLYIDDGRCIYKASLEDGSVSPLSAYTSYYNRPGRVKHQLTAWNNQLLVCDWEACRVLAVEDEMREIVHFTPEQSDMAGYAFKQAVAVGEGLYVLGEDYKAYRIDLTTPGRMRRIGNGFYEIAPWTGEQLLTLEYTYSNNSVISVMDAQGNKKPLMEAEGVDTHGLAADPVEEAFYFVQGASLHRYSHGRDETLRAIPQTIVRAGGMLVGNQYMTILSSGGCYLYDVEIETQTPLVIRGVFSMQSDFDFGAAHPEIGLHRSVSTQLTVQDVYQELLMGGEEVDLYFVPYSSGVKRMIEKGYAAPLPDSELLSADHESLYDVYAACLKWEDRLYAVPAYVECGSWTTSAENDEPVPTTLSEALDAAAQWADSENNTGQIYLGISFEYREWTALDWLDAALTQTMLERNPQEPLEVRHSAALRQVMEEVKTAYKAARLPLLPEEARHFDWDDPSAMIGQAGDSYEGVNTNSYAGRSWENERPVQGPKILEQEPMRYPAVMMVYILNPRSKHPREALAYLEWLAENREPAREALLRKDSVPVLHDHVQKEIESLSAEGNQEKVQTLLDNPRSWEVYGPVLDFYRDEVIPHTVVVADPLLERKQMTKQPIYPDFLDLFALYLQDRYSADQCLEAMQRILDTWWLENQ